jgi:diguanylate cyclase (GGDEF)-like protein
MAAGARVDNKSHVPIPSRIFRQLPRGRGLPEREWRARHRGILVVLLLLTAGLPVVALHRGLPPWHGFQDGAATIAVTTAAFVAGNNRRWGAVLATLGLMLAASAYIHVTGGLIEAHFLFFVIVGIVTLYQDWIAYLLTFAFTAVHHGVLGALQPESVYNHGAAVNSPVRWAFIHAAFMVAASIASVVAWKANEDLAVHDPLTRLPNRRLLTEHLDAALAVSATNAVLFIDLCGFKLVNDSSGHEVGDEVLRQIARRLRHAVREVDAVARFGGDEFVVVLTGVDETTARAAADRLLHEIGAPVVVGNTEVRIGASI